MSCQMITALALALIATSSDYKLIWADEFNRDGNVDPKDWIYETGFVRNKELQWYQPTNVICKGGKLIIEARREKLHNPNFDPKAPAEEWRKTREFAEYTSGAIETKGKHRWTYGRFECRAKIDIRSGSWPAFWTVGEAREWPRNGELDIMEFYSKTLLANAAWGTERQYVAKWDDTKVPIAKVAQRAGYVSPEAWEKDFHIWIMVWEPDMIRMYVDDFLMNAIDLKTTINASPDHANPFHEPHHILLNLAIGAAGGDPSTTQFPIRQEVDWVRIYQK